VRYPADRAGCLQAILKTRVFVLLLVFLPRKLFSRDLLVRYYNILHQSTKRNLNCIHIILEIYLGIRCLVTSMT
jgi:hypothetical protein